MKVHESASIILLQWFLEYLLCMYRIYCSLCDFIFVIANALFSFYCLLLFYLQRIHLLIGLKY